MFRPAHFMPAGLPVSQASRGTRGCRSSWASATRLAPRQAHVVGAAMVRCPPCPRAAATAPRLRAACRSAPQFPHAAAYRGCDQPRPPRVAGGPRAGLPGHARASSGIRRRTAAGAASLSGLVAVTPSLRAAQPSGFFSGAAEDARQRGDLLSPRCDGSPVIFEVACPQSVVSRWPNPRRTGTG